MDQITGRWRPSPHGCHWRGQRLTSVLLIRTGEPWPFDPSQKGPFHQGRLNKVLGVVPDPEEARDGQICRVGGVPTQPTIPNTIAVGDRLIGGFRPSCRTAPTLLGSNHYIDRLIYSLVHGQATIHTPHIGLSIPILRALSLAASRHAKASRKWLLSIPARQFNPDGAFAEHASTQAAQSPHRESSMGLAAGSSAPVSTLVKRTADPNVSVTRRAHLPIQPRPARVATVLC